MTGGVQNETRSGDVAAATPPHIDANALAAELRREVAGEVRFDDGSRALWATDASNYRQVPIGVVLPRTINDVVATMEIARRHGAPVLGRGGGTSLAGQCCNTAVVIDFSKYLNRVLEIDPAGRRARVQPGTVLDVLRDAAEEHGLTFGPDPSTHAWCTLGGMIGNNACGVRSLLTEFEGPGPRTEHSVESLEVLTYDGHRMRVGATPGAELDRIIAEGGRRGEIYANLRALRDRYADLIRARFPDIPRRVSGYNLDALLPEHGFNVARALTGTESTCVTILEATVTLVHSPPARVLLVLGYPSVYEAADHVPEIREYRPTGLEGMDDVLLAALERKGMHPGQRALLPPGGGWLLVEFGGDDVARATALARRAMDALQRRSDAPSMRLFEDRSEQKRIWEVRESGLGATAVVPGEPHNWEGWEDAAVAVDRLGDYLRAFRALLERYGFRASLYGHFGHGCVHTRIPFDLASHEGVEQYRRFTLEAAELVLRFGGSLSGEHGDGQSRADLLPLMFGDELVRAFREFKTIWDPDGRMNPGKVVDPFPRTANLRLGPGFQLARPETHFAFPVDDGSFGHAALRCVGVGKCRRTEHGIMCPSYMVLGEEMHSTRGRAHLLFEMLHGDVVDDGWRSEEVKEALDLCLFCKGCKGECPVNVDIATYKAEFLSHYYRGRLRPRHAYAFGLVNVWARLASRAPGVVNFLTQAPGLGRVARWAAGMPAERRFPVFAKPTFTQWFRERERQRRPTPRLRARQAVDVENDRAMGGETRRGGDRRVLLWPDTFNDHFHPGTLVAALEVLEHAGFEVVVPDARLCCGRPLYDFGMLDRAKRQLRQILDALRPELEAGTPVVGLEPSCVAVFRDELGGLFPDDETAGRLRRLAMTLGEFLEREAGDVDLPTLRRRAILHGHCHQQALAGMDADLAVLSRIGVDAKLLDSGCCGMAGAFGFEKEKYGVSVAVGERVLLPAVRAAEPDTLIVADGFSCREQIAQLTDRRAVHLAEVLRLAMR